MRVTFSAVLVKNTKGPTNCSLKINLEEYWKSIICEEILKLDMVDYVERKKKTGHINPYENKRHRSTFKSKTIKRINAQTQLKLSTQKVKHRYEHHIDQIKGFIGYLKVIQYDKHLTKAKRYGRCNMVLWRKFIFHSIVSFPQMQYHKPIATLSTPCIFSSLSAQSMRLNALNIGT